MSEPRIFCHFESAAFDRDEFESGAGGMVVHTAGPAPEHNTDGWPVIKVDGVWELLSGPDPEPPPAVTAP